MSLSPIDMGMLLVLAVTLLIILMVAITYLVAWIRTEHEYRQIIKQNKHEMIIRRMKMVIAKLKIGRTRIY